MNSDYFEELPNSLSQSDGLIRRCSLVIGTLDCTYYGQIFCFKSERLLDVLNHGSAGDQPDLPADYLELHQAEVCSLNRQKNTASENCLIVKRGILFVAENIVTEIRNQSIYKGDSNLVYPKRAVGVEIHLPGLSLVGQMHIDLWQRLMGALNDDRQFLPVTEALLSRPNAGSAEFEFVAVNRNQISYLAKME